MPHHQELYWIVVTADIRMCNEHEDADGQQQSNPNHSKDGFLGGCT